MLNLLGVPTWQLAGAPDHRIPVSLPACLLVYLACQGRWVEREVLADVFWPQRPRDEARHNLRVNLHRVRQLLDAFAQGHTLQSERSRVCLQLPLDLDALRAAISKADGAALLRLQPARWLEGFQLGGFDAFWDWSRALSTQLQSQWRAAGERALVTHGATQPAPHWLVPLHNLLHGAVDHNDGMGDGMGDGADDHLAHPPASAIPLFGRQATLQTLRRPAVRAMVLVGEAGMGKSSLLHAALAQAPLLKGREGLQQIPYRPVAEYLLSHMGTLRALLQRGGNSLGAYRLDLARLLPDLAPDDPLPPLDMMTAKSRLLEGLARVFESLGDWLLVDDLQWCDSSTLELLSLLTHRGVLRWRAAARGHELSDAQRQWAQQLEQTGHLTLLPLEGLGLDAVAQCCRQRRPQQAWSDAELKRLHTACTGNPFVLNELLLALPDAPAEPDGGAQTLSLPRSVRELLQRRLRALPAAARALVEAASVAVRPLPLNVLTQLADGASAWPDTTLLDAVQTALHAEMLREERDGLQCRHDLVRQAVEAGLTVTARQTLHRRAALALGGRPEGNAEPLAVAAHWSAAQEPQTALAWMQRGAVQLKMRGRFDEARALWTRVADESLDATQALQARLALAECELLTDLARGRTALLEVLAQVSAVAEPAQRDQIEGQTLAGLVDNAVFSGDLAAARDAAERLRPLLPRLRVDDRVHACEVLIELAMREPDIPAAWALLEQMQRLAPARPSTLSFAAQIHWFAGDARAACAAFEALLSAHPDYCSGLTIENDLAVMLQALGQLPRAELMARRSLASWAGVAHTETLSWLVLGTILTSAGRHDEALAAFDNALLLGRAQASPLFEAEALVRRARLHLQCGNGALAGDDLDYAEPMLRGSADPMRVSLYAWLRVRAQIELGQTVDRGFVKQLRDITQRSAHPLLHLRLAGIEAEIALQDGDHTAAEHAAQRQARIADGAGLLEMLADALLLQARACTDRVIAQVLRDKAHSIAHAQGFGYMVSTLPATE
ncbi:AAA family ATPase [Rhodoferax sp. AJA081-3]|uniref:AAA family ATPase n=1 Tax=Rhodoferax sp. AJA081-3 TaxID=2752316 RepID=UPI001ADF6FB4|nr:AAA family ATPase [Rhodoferax sp. AJA081-3]QTN27620.1 AAA family ATPase [Rhodoferax sp. AJA081-3]